jgi:malate dehydrogenase (oxaloacetate-decarboxylating)
MKTFSMKIDPLTGEDYYDVYLRGQQLLNDPLLNKASAFTEEERLGLELSGLIRHGVSSLETQKLRALENFHRKSDDLERYIFLNELLNRSEPLFYRLMVDNLEEMVPIVYTPTVGQACLQLSHITRRYRGIYIGPDNIAAIDQIFQAISLPSTDLIVVTDGERILGLGDLGSDGMGIPVGKVALYVAAGGLHPACCLPITLDVGTNNERLQKDPLYLGNQHPRLEGKAYEEFIEKFVLGVRRNFPGALLQWEDFAKHKAFRNLDRYRSRILSFNDDIQGTGATALSALMTAMRIKQERFSDNRFVIVGMGQAGTGIASCIRAALRGEGLSDADIKQRIFALDVQGLLLDDDPNLERPQWPFAQNRSAIEGWNLESPDKIAFADVVRNAKPTVLIGVTGKKGLFSEAILAEVARHTARPVILALSNPTSKTECSPEEVARATGGLGLVATGSPFQPVPWEGRAIAVSQCNNMYIFPGVGLGALVARATKVTDEMFIAGSRAISSMVTPTAAASGALLPPVQVIREVSAQVALAVAKEARDSGLGRLLEDREYERIIRRAQWDPQYTPFRPGAMR